MFLAHFTSSGIAEILEFDVDFFDSCLKAAAELYELERNAPVKAIVLGFAKEGE